jgi:hypothetical protein
MRELQLDKKDYLINSGLEHNLGVLTSVDRLTNYDMIYVYHLMKIGDKLSLRRDYSNPFETDTVEVFFKGFKIGTISRKSAPIISRLIDKGCPVMATIKEVMGEKYKPFSVLDVEIKALVD